MPDVLSKYILNAAFLVYKTSSNIGEAFQRLRLGFARLVDNCQKLGTISDILQTRWSVWTSSIPFEYIELVHMISWHFQALSVQFQIAFGFKRHHVDASVTDSLAESQTDKLYVRLQFPCQASVVVSWLKAMCIVGWDLLRQLYELLYSSGSCRSNWLYQIRYTDR